MEFPVAVFDGWLVPQQVVRADIAGESLEPIREVVGPGNRITTGFLRQEPQHGNALERPYPHPCAQSATNWVNSDVVSCRRADSIAMHERCRVGRVEIHEFWKKPEQDFSSARDRGEALRDLFDDFVPEPHGEVIPDVADRHPIDRGQQEPAIARETLRVALETQWVNHRHQVVRLYGLFDELACDQSRPLTRTPEQHHVEPTLMCV